MTVRRLAPLLASTLLLGLLACSDLPSENQVPAARTVAQDFESLVEFTVTNECNGERVDFAGDLAGFLRVETDGPGLRVELSGELDATGIGAETGTEYDAAGQLSFARREETLRLPIVIEIPFEARVTGPGTPDWEIRVITLVRVPEGVDDEDDISAEVRVPRSECQT